VLALVLSVLFLTSCGGGNGSGEGYSNWDIAGGCASDQGGTTRPSGAGTQVDICAAVGAYQWVWVTYVAPWCAASRSQAPQVRTFAQGVEGEVAVFTVLTASDEPFSAASVGDARAWAGSYGMPAARVLAEQVPRTIPQHLLIGPDGRTFYRYVGYLDAAEMRGILDDFRQSIRMPDVRSLPAP
jgi:hypothetical protein